MSNIYVADFETTTNINDCRVWAYAICDVKTLDIVKIGTTIEDFFEWCKKQPDNPKVYFHNLKFDSQFLIYYMFHNGFKHVLSKDRASNTFTTVINAKGFYYAVESIYYLKGKKVKKTTFLDSMKLIPMSVEKIADAFHLPYKKLKIDYSAHNDLPEGTPLDPDEEKYIIHDVKIVAHALKFFLENGFDRMTIGSCALHTYKNMLGKNNFKRYFPTLQPQVHAEIRQAYKGGWSFVNFKYVGKKVGAGVVADNNSIYPFVMRYKLLPHGTPIFYHGKYKFDSMYPLYVQMIRCQFELKPGKLPTIQLKHSMWYSGNDYLTTSDNQEITLCLTSVDLKIFLEHYDTYNLEYISGYKFKATRGLFDKFVDTFNSGKIKAREEKNWGFALINKLILNALSGKFGTDTLIRTKIPYLSEDDVIHYKDAEPEEKDGIYIPMACFITAYAREITIGSAQRVCDEYNAGISNIDFAYSDTDSLHLLSPDGTVPEWLEIDKLKLGAWKFESKFKRGKFLRAKCYIEDSTEDIESDNPEYSIKVTVAGMPDSCKHQVNFNNFKIGATYTGKLQPKAVKGGVILQDIDFTIKK